MRENAEAWVRKLDFNAVVPNWEYVQDLLKRLKTYKPVNPITATKMPNKKALIKNLQAVRASVRDSVRAQSYLAGYLAIKDFMHLDYEHPVFDIIRLGVIVLVVDGKVKVFGKAGKLLGEFDEAEIK